MENEKNKKLDQKRKEIIESARQTNLAEYLLSKNIPLIRNGKRYKDEEHDSLVFSGNMYYWNKKQENGNAIDYLTRHLGFSFNGAVKELAGIDITDFEDIKEKSINEKNKIKNISSSNLFSLNNLTLEKDTRWTVAYLNKTRYIDNMIIKNLFDEKYLYQQCVTHNKDGKSVDAHNIVFPIYDEKRTVVGAETAGTLSYSDKRFKGIEEGSKYGYGFNIILNSSGLIINNPAPISKLYFFESALDLISFVELANKKGVHLNNNMLVNSIFISMAGLKNAVFDYMPKYFRCDKAEKFICVDTDEAGKNFAALIKNKYPDVKILLPDEQGKDWNDQLKYIKTRSTNNIDSWRNEIETERGNNAAKEIESDKRYERIEKI